MKTSSPILFTLILLATLQFESVRSQTLIAEYEFAGTLADRLSGSTLTAFGPTADAYSRNNIETAFLQDANGDYWSWKSNQVNGGGFWIDVNSDIRTNYSIGLRFCFNETGSGYKKIIDYQNSESDNGFYFYGNKLTFYPSAITGATTISNNQLVDLVVTRSTDGTFKAYFVVNGVVVSTPEINYNASTNGSPVLIGGKPRFGFFFNDKNYSGEATTGGKVYGIKIWNAAFASSAEIQAAMNPKATVANVGITGATGVVLTPKDVVVTLLQSITISSTIAQGTDLSSWITNLPAGLTARAKTAISSGATGFTLEITGTPSAVLSAPIQITIPSAYLTPSSSVIAAQNLNATFGIAPYTVTYNGNSNTSGTAPVDGNNYAAGSSVTVLSNSGSLLKTGYNFNGWNTMADGSGTSYAVGSSFEMGSYNVTLYARWTLAATPPPTVTTQAVSSITQTTVTANGNITNLGSPNPTAHGFCYGTSINPSINNATYTNRGAASSTGAFSSNITALTPGTTYYVRAYATNTGGTSYGEQVSFTTVAIACTFTGGSLYTPAAFSPSSLNQAFGRFELSAASTGVSLTNATVKLNGTRTGATNFKLWYSSDNTFSSVNDVQLGTTIAADPGTNNSITFSGFSQAVSISGGYFFVTCDLSVDATGAISGQLVDNNSLSLSSGALSAGAINNTNLSSGESAFPVELTTFTTSVSKRNVLLTWQTATEVNSASYSIERRVPGKDFWKTVGEVKAAGYSNSPKNYSFVDKNAGNGKLSYRLKIIDLDGSFEYSQETEAIIVPQKLELYKNYPNPFNPTTMISFALPADSRVTITVYSILGDKVADLFNGQLTAGYHSMQFNGGMLTSGIYFFQLKTENVTLTEKMILSK